MAQYDGDIVRKHWCSDDINQVGADSRRFRTYQRLAALRADARSHNSIFFPKGYGLAENINHGPKVLTEDMKDSHMYFKRATEGWQLGIIQDVTTCGNIRLPYTVDFLDLEQRFNVVSREGNYTVDLEAPPSSWRFQMFGRTKSVRRKMVQPGKGKAFEGSNSRVVAVRDNGFVSPTRRGRQTVYLNI